MTPTGGSHGKPHRTTKILSHARRRGGDVAARGARTAAGDVGDRLSQRLGGSRRSAQGRVVANMKRRRQKTTSVKRDEARAAARRRRPAPNIQKQLDQWPSELAAARRPLA